MAGASSPQSNLFQIQSLFAPTNVFHLRFNLFSQTYIAIGKFYLLYLEKRGPRHMKLQMTEPLEYQGVCNVHCALHTMHCVMRGRWILLSVALGGIIIIWDEFDSCRFCKGKIDQLWVSCAVGGTSQSDEEVLNLRSTCHTALDACERDSSCRWTSLHHVNVI